MDALGSKDKTKMQKTSHHANKAALRRIKFKTPVKTGDIYLPTKLV